MIKYIDLSRSKLIPLTLLSEEYVKYHIDDKGWTYSSVYHFSELKDIYLALRDYSFTNLKDFSSYCTQIKKIKPEKTEWDEKGRRILENLNALKNFGLVRNDYTIKKDVFQESSIGSPLSTFELQTFKQIYYSYIRFKEIHTWFTEPYQSNRKDAVENFSTTSLERASVTLFPFSRLTRFTDSFITELVDNTDILYIDNPNRKNEDLMRFWDVYVKWGEALGVIQKFNLKNLDYAFSSNFKSLSCIYHVNTDINQFDLLKFLKENYSSKYINIPKLVLKIAIKHRFSINKIKELILKQAQAEKKFVSLQRTSEIFIRTTEKDFIPKLNDSYISHLLLN